LVLTSPLVRARQTAEEICAALGDGSSPVESAVLRPGATAGPIIDEISVRHPGTIEVVCVGHMPDLGYVAAQLGAGPDCQPLKLKTGSLVRVDLDGRESRLIWLLSPQVVRQLASGGAASEEG
jgi:phosphohistidine phosphatase SixA